MESDTFPESWREALIISISKPGKDHLVLLIKDLFLSQVTYVKLLKEWSINVLCGIWKRMVYWLNNSVVIGQIDRLWIT